MVVVAVLLIFTIIAAGIRVRGAAVLRSVCGGNVLKAELRQRTPHRIPGHIYSGVAEHDSAQKVRIM